MGSIKYYLKQLLPLKYECNYASRMHHHVTWRMWFGKCFNIKEVAK